jgi:hypothetical protein
LLVGGTTVDFLAASLEVMMPSAIPGATANRISFDSTGKAGIRSQGLGETGITMNGKPISYRQKKGPVWDGLKDLVLMPALYKAAQAAQIARDAPVRPSVAPDYVAIVASIEKGFGIVPITFF